VDTVACGSYSGIANDLLVRSDQGHGDFFLLDRTAQGPASCRLVSGGMSGVLGAAMLLRCRGLQLADQVPGAG
jgi:hypothetical protein